MDNLKKYQETFVSNVIKKELSDHLDSMIIPVGELSNEEVIGVYHGDYFARYTEALGEIFETVWAVVGDDEFFTLAHDYIDSNPSHYRELGEVRRQFPEFLKSHRLQNEFPFLVDVAYFENIFWDIFHLKRSEKTSNIDLDFQTFISTQFDFNEGVKIFSFDYKIFDLWKLRKVGLNNFTENIKLPQFLILYKKGALVEASELSANQYQIIQNLMNNQNLEEAIAEVEVSSDEIQSLFTLFSSNFLFNIRP